MDNRAIRHRARKLWTSHFPAPMLVAVLLLLRWGAKQLAPFGWAKWPYLITAYALLAAVIQLLACGICLGAWREEPLRLPRFGLKQTGRALLYMWLSSLPLILSDISAYVIQSISSSAIGAVLYLGLCLAFALFTLWLSIRLRPFPMLVYLEPERGFRDCIRDALQCTKGHFGRIFCMGLTLSLPAIAAILILAVAFSRSREGFYVGVCLFNLFYWGYTELAFQALSLELLGKNVVK